MPIWVPATAVGGSVACGPEQTDIDAHPGISSTDMSASAIAASSFGRAASRFLAERFKIRRDSLLEVGMTVTFPSFSSQKRPPINLSE